MELVKVIGDKVVTDSLMVAEVFGKEHKHVVRDIENQIQKLEIAEEFMFMKSNFGLEKYVAANNKESKMYTMTEDGFAIIAMAYTTPEAMKMKVAFLNEFKRMKEHIQSQVKPLLTDKEKLFATMQATLLIETDVNQLKDDVTEMKVLFEKSLTIDFGEQNVISNNVKKRVEYLWDHKIVNASVHDTKKKVYAALWKDLKNAFAVASYRDIKKKEFEEAVSFVKGWRPRLV